MFFSVVVPVYNVEKYLSECVESILGQSFTDFELILVDDGSKDGSGALCDQYAAEDSRVKVIHKPNGGLSDARNAGTDMAVGEYVVYIDSDDYIYGDDFLSSLYEKAKEGTDIICFKFRKYFESTKAFSKCSFAFPELDKYNKLSDRVKYLVRTDSFYCSAWSKAVRLALIKDNGIVFERGLLGEDQEWYYHVMLKAKSIDGIDRDFLVYRQRENSITSSWKMKNLTDCIYIIEKWYKGIGKADIAEDYKEALYNSLAKLYCNLLIGYTRFGDKEKKTQRPRLKALSPLMRYAVSPRVAILSKPYRLGGFALLSLLLKIICKIRT